MRNSSMFHRDDEYELSEHPHPREWELNGELHRTKEDAFRQVMKARAGSLVAATDDYLSHLEEEIYKWLREVQEARYK
jgi:hypothetical protein